MIYIAMSISYLISILIFHSAFTVYQKQSVPSMISGTASHAFLPPARAFFLPTGLSDAYCSIRKLNAGKARTEDLVRADHPNSAAMSSALL